MAERRSPSDPPELWSETSRGGEYVPWLLRRRRVLRRQRRIEEGDLLHGFVAVGELLAEIRNVVADEPAAAQAWTRRRIVRSEQPGLAIRSYPEPCTSATTCLQTTRSRMRRR